MTTRRNPLERRQALAPVMASESGIVVPDLAYDYSQIDESNRDEVRAAALDIKERSGRVKLHLDRARDGMLEIGRRLAGVKALLPHGQFSDWCAIELDVSQRSAQRMMQAAEAFGDKSDTVSLLSDSALYLLSGPSVPAAAREEIVIEAQAAGKSPTKEQVQTVIKKHKSSPAPATARTLTLDETIAVIWRLLKHGCVGEQRPEKLKELLATRTKPEDYRHVYTGDVTLDAAVFDRAWRTVANELDGRIAHKAKAAPVTITLTFALLGDEAERKAQYDWFKGLEQTTLAAYMQALYQTNGEL